MIRRVVRACPGRLRIGIATALVETVTPVVVAFSGDAPAQGQVTSDTDTVLAQINDARSASGLAPLTFDGSLTTLADSWAATLADAGTLSHTSDLAGTVGAVMPDATTMAENVGVGTTASDVEAAFLASPDHLANTLGDYSSVGIAVVVGSDGRTYVVEEFAGTSAATGTVTFTAAAVPAPAPAPAPDAALEPADQPVVEAASGDEAASVMAASARVGASAPVVVSAAPAAAAPPLVARGACLPDQAQGRGSALGRCDAQPSAARR